MSGAYRCGSIGESRQWLECYYGAAQPIRKELGLAPAPVYQQHLVQAPPQGTPADSDVRDTVMAAAAACAAQADDRQWLNCFYAASQPMRVRLGLAPAPVARANAAPPARAALRKNEGWFSGIIGDDTPSATQDQFALPGSNPEKAAIVNRLASRMAAYSFDRYGIFTVRLANGQVWQQVSGDEPRAHWEGPPEKYLVTIVPAVFGGYNLKASDRPGWYKAHRIR